jgi:hypothetical protein
MKPCPKSPKNSDGRKMISKISRGYIVALENSVPPHVTTDTVTSSDDIFCCHRFKPKNMTDDIFLGSWGTNSWGLMPRCRWGQSYKDFYVAGH